jgi:hypothetical protein
VPHSIANPSPVMNLMNDELPSTDKPHGKRVA